MKKIDFIPDEKSSLPAIRRQILPTKNKPLKTCSCCGTLFSADVESVFYHNYGGPVVKKCFCSVKCRDEIYNQLAQITDRVSLSRDGLKRILALY